MEVIVISGSRADIGPLMPVVAVLNAKLIRLRNDPVSTPKGIARSCGNQIQETVYLLDGYSPDFVIILGDRFEILAAATAVHLLGIPLVHLSGGDVTEGSQDNAMRHAITKLAHIHFPTNTASAKRIMAMGEEPWRISAVGCPGIDQLNSIQLMTKEETLKKLCVSDPYILVSYQPETLANDPVAEAMRFLEALYNLRLPCVFSSLNPDVGSAQIQDKFERFCAGGRGVIMDMPQNLYLSAMKHCQVMIGNSSSGLYEAPTLKVPFVNVGWRQLGREQAKNVVSTPNEPESIYRAVKEALRIDLRGTVNPYGDGHAAERIKDLLQNKFSQIPRQQLLTKKWSQITD